MIIKSLYWDLRDSGTQHEYLYELVRNAPGRLGFYLRARLLAKRMDTAGNYLRVHKGCRIINLVKMKVGNHVHFGVDPLVVVVNRNGKDLLGFFLLDYILVQDFLYLRRFQ